ncbi:MAG: DUF87 domain-containing protein [Candidatus Aminicenantes bacterium]|nr:DUF87 domain-containing protein [Candidatus Aminicenantes bacterium]
MSSGKFFLGREYSIQERKLTDRDYLLKADHLTTHGMVFGMTGSGKTGLCLALLEEAIAEDIPLIMIDPKGDLADLALLFPDFSPADFKPWISPTEAAKAGKSVDDFARETAGKWKEGLSEWGIKKEQIEKIKEKADIRIFTPGSSAGLSCSVLEGFKKPAVDFADDEEGLVEKIKSSVSALLALLDIENDPLKSKPHILISNIIEHYWRLGRSVSIEDLIINIQKPPLQKLGVFDLEKLISDKERTDLAFELNNIVASPSFRFWSSGMPLAAEALYKKSDRTPVNIFYIAHLTDNERMFFVTLLLNEIVYWMRRQQGSGNLKYLLYMDEIFGYLPPYPLNPPSKNPLLILLKQARAFGLGVVLATQNPKDIDYKALTNMGAWFIGKLQAEGDRERVMEGLSGIVDPSGEGLDNDEVKDIMKGLENRRFLVKNVHDKGLKVFQTRWVMSYLAGPLTREQIKNLTADQKKNIKEEKPPAEDRPAAGKGAVSAGKEHLLPFAAKPAAPMDFLYDNSARQGSYSPLLYLDGELIYDEQSLGLYVRKKFFASAPLGSAVDWQKANIGETEPVYSAEPVEQTAGYEPLPVKLDFSLVKQLQTSFKEYLFNRFSLPLFVNKELNLASDGVESKEAFKQRCRDVVEKMIDKEIEKEKESYEKRIKRLEDRMAEEKIRLERARQERRAKATEEIISVGETVLGMLLGGRSRRGLTTAARKRRMTSAASGRVEINKEKLSQLDEELQQIQQELEDKAADIEDDFYKKADNIQPLEVRLEKNDIIISRQALLWKLS